LRNTYNKTIIYVNEEKSLNYKKLPWRGIIVSLILLISFCFLVYTLIIKNSLTTPTNNINVRTGPNLSYSVKDTLKKGQRIHIMTKKENWYKIRYQDNTGWVASWLVNKPKKGTITTKLSEATIVLDPGHGGSDSGALSQGNQEERTYTLQQAKMVEKQLKRYGANVIMTRKGNQTVSLGDRAELATDNHADAFISFHYDSSPIADSATGFTTYYYHTSTSLRLAKTVNSEFSNLPLTNRGVKFGNFLVIRDNLRPALLLEMGYINTKKDFSQIKSTRYQKRVAVDITKGLNAYFKNLEK